MAHREGQQLNLGKTFSEILNSTGGQPKKDPWRSSELMACATLGTDSITREHAVSRAYLRLSSHFHAQCTFRGS